MLHNNSVSVRILLRMEQNRLLLESRLEFVSGSRRNESKQDESKNSVNKHYGSKHDGSKQGESKNSVSKHYGSKHDKSKYDESKSNVNMNEEQLSENVQLPKLLNKYSEITKRNSLLWRK